MEFILDVRDLPPPEPLERTLAALPSITEGTWLRLIHRREPCMLFPQLVTAGFAYKVCASVDDDGEKVFFVFIWKANDQDLGARVAEVAAQAIGGGGHSKGSSC